MRRAKAISILCRQRLNGGGQNMNGKTTFYTKHHLKFEKNQADNLVAVFNRFICDFGADFFLYFIGV